MRNVRMTIWVVVVVVVGSAQGTLVEWSVSEGGNGHWYEAVLSSNYISWSDARSDALSRGGDLATITSGPENGFVFSLINESQYWHEGTYWMGPWIGGYQQENAQSPTEGWGWVTGEAFDFTAWAPGQPNDAGIVNGIQDRIQFWHGSGINPTWQDVFQDNLITQSYVVEYVPEPTTLLLLGLGGLMLRRKR